MGQTCKFVWMSTKLTQIPAVEVFSFAAGIWHHWFWLWARAAVFDAESNGFEEEEVGGLAVCWSLPRSLPEAAAAALQSDCLQGKHLSLSGPESLFQKNLAMCFMFFIFLLFHLLSSSLSLRTQDADLNTSYISYLSSCAFMQILPVCHSSVPVGAPLCMS